MSVLFPGIQITLDKPRTVKFDFNANVKLETETGINTLLENPLHRDHFNSAMLRAMLWAGLLREDKTLTIEQVGEMITTANSTDAMRAVFGAWTETLPEADGEKAVKPSDPPSPARPSVG